MTDQNSVAKPLSGEPKAPQLTLADIESKIRKTNFHIVPETTTTVCTLVLANGFTVTGTSACVSPKTFNKELGEKYAREDAIAKVWQLEGYLLKEKLSKAPETPEERVVDELAELSIRLGKLNSLLNRPERPAFISSVHYALLHGQQKVMEKYSQILLKRLELFERGDA